MRPERALVAERALARHCPELLRAGPGPDELLARLARGGERFARALATALIPLLGEAPVVRCDPPRETEAEAFALAVGPLAANSLIAGPAGTRLCLSVEAEAVLRLVDRAVGGRGEAPDPLPEAFPLSAELMIARIEGLCIAALSQALDLPATALSPLARAGALAELEAFPAGARLAVLSLYVTEPGGTSWTMQVALPTSALPALLGEVQVPAPAARLARRHPAEAPFGDLPLTLNAVLVDTRLSMAALSKLRPGDILPVAVARSVPLQIDGRTIAQGQVGALDDRVALQLTHVF